MPRRDAPIWGSALTVATVPARLIAVAEMVEAEVA
jgi:hypothetical protein